jgi:flagellar biosynthesis protein FliP
MLSSNASHYTGPAADQGAEPYVALRLLATVLRVLAALVMVVGGLIAIIVILGSLGAAGAAARFAPGAVTAGVAGAGLFGGFLILLGAAVYALVLWAAAQSIGVLLSIEGRARESAALQRAMLAQLRRIADGAPSSR